MKKLLFIMCVLQCWQVIGCEGITWWHMRIHIVNRLRNIGLKSNCIDAREASIVQAIDAWAAAIEILDKSLYKNSGEIVGISEEHYQKVDAQLRSIECKAGITAGELIIQQYNVDTLYSDLPQWNLAAAEPEDDEGSSCFFCCFR